MINGEHDRKDALTLNGSKEKHLTSTRDAGSEEVMKLIPPRKVTKEQAIEYISEDERVECTPENIRIRKKILDPTKRLRSGK